MEKTSNHRMLNILRTICIIYFLSVVKCCILNCSLMIKITVCCPDQITSYDADDKILSANLVCLAGPAHIIPVHSCSNYLHRL